MTSRFRSLPWLVAALLASVALPSKGQDTPLYRDPSPTEGPRIEGPLLPSAPPGPTSTPPPPPPSALGPFQSSNPNSVAPPGEPLLGIAPLPPPLPALPMAPFAGAGDVLVRRKTTIRPPNGPLCRCHEWFRDAVFGPPKPSATATGPKRGYHGDWYSIPPEGDTLTRLLNWQAWSIWPFSDGP
jgi:hypothetical protein